MKNLNHLFIFVILFTSLSCKKDDDGSKGIPIPNVNKAEYLMFGHYYGMCVGEECVEIFQITDSKLYEDTKDNYPTIGTYYEGEFVQLGNEKFKLVEDLENFLPDSLLILGDSTFGCPDCADQGGLYIEYKKGKVRNRWLIDQSQFRIPSFLVEFQEKVNEKIAAINQK